MNIKDKKIIIGEIVEFEELHNSIIIKTDGNYYFSFIVEDVYLQYNFELEKVKLTDELLVNKKAMFVNVDRTKKPTDSMYRMIAIQRSKYLLYAEYIFSTCATITDIII